MFGLVPYGTRQETWERDAVGTVRHEVTFQSNWDSNGCGWKLLSISSEYLGIPGSQLVRTTTRGFECDTTHWFNSRVTSEIKPGQAPVTFSFNDDNTLHGATVNLGGYPELTTNYTYSGHPDPSSASLTSPHLAQSGLVGAAYGFDDYGLISTITPFGVGWSMGETHDPIGRVVQQSGANSEKTTIQWDPAGRLASLQPVPEAASGVTYPDLLTCVVTRGQQQMVYRYNGFGELVQLSRQGGSKTLRYDNAGRKTSESIWVGDDIITKPGPGSMLPISKTGPVLLQVEQGDGGASNLAPDPGRITVEVLGATAVAGTTFHYDGQGRVDLVTDPNGEWTQTLYEGSKKRVIHGGIETQYIHDALGQLVKVTDALGQVTAYVYDDAGRVTQVQQTGSTGTQTRAWHYNPLGWLDQLTQPESGTTTYSSFTVQGKAQVTDYNGRTVTTTYDSLGRVARLTSGDGSISQDLVYGENEPGHGLANNKLVRATAGGITRTLDYLGIRGRISQLTRSVDGLNFSQSIPPRQAR